ncbi:MAG: nucleotidyltransferase family protein [Rubrivivax sp.]|nr:nucleotidyltransferase family protein [Rubrivivax sp.]MDP3610317.1 nucleotidyltransferase family protein [Rubrivivax sp.]
MTGAPKSATKSAATGDLLSGLWTLTEPPRLTPRQWELLLSQARRCRLDARLARHFKDKGWLDGVPSQPRLHLQSATLAAERQRQQVRWETDRLRAALRDLPSPVVLLKGAAYVALDLPPARGRLFTDVDILVDKAGIGAAELLLMAAGWVHEALDPYDERYYRQWMHELPPLKHVWRHTWLDVHHTITPPTSRFAVDGSLLLQAARPLPGSQPGAQLATLAPVDMVLHSAVHLMQEGDFSAGLRDLLDLNDLLQHFGVQPGFWPQLFDRAQELHIGTALFHVLVQVRRLFGTAPPAELAPRVDELARGWPSTVLMPALLAIALRPPHPSCNSAASGLARWLLYVRSHGLRMPWYQIVPHLLRKAWTRTRTRLQAPAAGAAKL